MPPDSYETIAFYSVGTLIALHNAHGHTKHHLIFVRIYIWTKTFLLMTDCVACSKRKANLMDFCFIAFPVLSFINFFFLSL